MRIIDANTGHEVRVGRPFDNVDGLVIVHAVNEGWFSAQALISLNDSKPSWHPLTVRYTHPGFMFQKIGFINS